VEGCLEGGQVGGLWGEIQVGHLGREVVDLGREALEGCRNVDARLKEGTEEREKHMFSDGDSGNVGWSDGREARFREAQDGCCLIEERD